MRTPTGGTRSTQWVIQSRRPPVEEGAVEVWERWAGQAHTAAQSKTILHHLRTVQPEREWRAVRVESVQRIEDW